MAEPLPQPSAEEPVSKNAKRRARKRALKQQHREARATRVAASAPEVCAWPTPQGVAPHALVAGGEVRVAQLPHTLVAAVPFDAAWALRPTDRGKVYHRGADRDDRGVPAHRFYACFGASPPCAEESHTYMFSADGRRPASEAPPALFRPILDRVNEDAPAKYNQVVVNWYEVGHDFTPSHFDCVRGMVPGATVATVSLVERSDAAPRHLVFKPTKAVAAADRRHLRIPTAHGQCVTFGGAALSDWRHGVPAATAPHGAPERAVSRRVSLTFRAYRAS